MRRSCQKLKPCSLRRGRIHRCYFWGPGACRPERTRAPFSRRFVVDPCLGTRPRRREPPRTLPGY
jgi:hypothetical protein